MASSREHEGAARIRAACAYADLKQPQAAAAMGFSTRTWARVEAGERALDRGQIAQLAELCNVPVEFFRDGFLAGEATIVAQEIDRIGRDLAAHREMVAGYVRNVLEARDREMHQILSVVEQNHNAIEAHDQRVRENVDVEIERQRHTLEGIQVRMGTIEDALGRLSVDAERVLELLQALRPSDAELARRVDEEKERAIQEIEQQKNAGRGTSSTTPRTAEGP